MALEWLFIAGLAVWIYLQAQRIKTLSRAIERMQRRIENHERWMQSEDGPAWAPPEPANEEMPELLLTERIDPKPAAERRLELVRPPIAANAGFNSRTFPAQAAALLKDPNAQGELVLAGALLALLLGAFYLLHVFAADGARLDAFTENAIRALILIGSGFAALTQVDTPSSFITRWRGHVLIGAGLLLGIIANGLIYNPWWGVEPARIDGQPLFNTQTLAFDAPAALALIAAHLFYPRNLKLARLYAIAGAIFAVCWVALELRHVFHAPLLAIGPIGMLEGDLYGLAALAVACAVAYAVRHHAFQTGNALFAHDLHEALPFIASAGLLIGGYFLLLMRNPWWGVHDAAPTGAAEGAFASLALAPATALALLLGLELPKRAPNVSFAAASACALYGLAFGFAALRWQYHHDAMDNRPQFEGVEALLYALWPLAFIAIGATLTQRFKSHERVREFALDLEAIWAVAAWPALIFGGIGLWALFNPWRGIWPARVDEVAAFLAILCYPAAAALSLLVAQLEPIRRDPLFPGAAKMAAVVHLFAGAMLVARWVFHGGDMISSLRATTLEVWTYSAIWAALGATAFGLGAIRRDTSLRWAGLALLFGVAAKVVVTDLGQLSGPVRALTFLGAVTSLGALAWFTRSGVSNQHAPEPDDRIIGSAPDRT